MIVPELGEIIEDLARILAPVIPLDRPESVVIPGKIGVVFLDDAASALEIDLFPIAKVRQYFDDSPPTIAAWAEERIVVMRGEQESAQIVWKTVQLFQDLLARTSG